MVQYLGFTSVLLLHEFIKLIFIFKHLKSTALYQGASVPGLTHGKMYKRATFEHLALHSELVSGLLKMRSNRENFKTRCE